MVQRNENALRTPSTPVSDQTSQEKRRKLNNDKDTDVEAARADYKTRLSNAWRTCKGVGFGPGSYGGGDGGGAA